MRCLLLSILLSGSSAFMMAPAAVARPRSVVRAEKEGEAVARKKGIPLALLIWPLIAVGDDVRARADTSMRITPSPRPREDAPVFTHTDLRLASPAAPRGAGHRDASAALLEHELPQEVTSFTVIYIVVGDAPYDIAPKK